MLETASTHTMIAVRDLGRAQDFYSGTLGLVGREDAAGTTILYGSAGGTWFMIYASPDAGTATTTCMRFEVEDIESAVTRLRDRGVVFEEMNLPGLKTVDGIARQVDGIRAAWLKDPDGNILKISEGTVEAFATRA